MAPNNCIIDTVGFRFNPKGQKAILHHVADDFEELFSFVPEDDNEYDEFAVAVFFNGIKAGYVAREDAPHMRKFLDEYSSFRNNIIEVNLNDKRSQINAISFSLVA